MGKKKKKKKNQVQHQIIYTHQPEDVKKIGDLIDHELEENHLNPRFIPQWSFLVKKMKILDLTNLFLAVLLKDKNNIMRWYFVKKYGSKREQVGEYAYITGPNSFIGKLMIENYAKNKRDFCLLGDQFKIMAFVIVDSERYNNHLKSLNNSEILVEDEMEQYIVTIYFQLTNKCMRLRHHVEEATAKTINIKNGLPVEVNVFHCLDCNQYFINYEALQHYINRGIYPALHFQIDNVEENGLRKVSDLMAYGYNVREGELSEAERHKILAWIIDAGLISKATIIKNLQFKVNYNGKKSGNENAKKKWENDIIFVSHYTKGNGMKINAKFVKRKNG